MIRIALVDTAEEAYSIRVISEVALSERGLFHVETWIENDEYRSSIYLNGERITVGGKESLPYFDGEHLYYVVDGKTLVRQKQFGEPEKLITLGVDRVPKVIEGNT